MLSSTKLAKSATGKVLFSGEMVKLQKLLPMQAMW